MPQERAPFDHQCECGGTAPLDRTRPNHKNDHTNFNKNKTHKHLPSHTRTHARTHTHTHTHTHTPGTRVRVEQQTGWAQVRPFTHTRTPYMHTHTRTHTHTHIHTHREHRHDVCVRVEQQTGQARVCPFPRHEQRLVPLPVLSHHLPTRPVSASFIENHSNTDICTIIRVARFVQFFSLSAFVCCGEGGLGTLVKVVEVCRVHGARLTNASTDTF